MKSLVIFGLFLLSTMDLKAQDFFLTDKAGIQYGPFAFREGEKINVAGQELAISKVLSKEQMMIEKMKEIIISQLEFRQANIPDVMSYLHHMSYIYDKTNQYRGLSSIVQINPQQVVTSATPEKVITKDSISATNDFENDKSQLITLSAYNISLYEAINVICKQCDLQWSIKDSLLVIEPKVKANSRSKPSDQ